MWISKSYIKFCFKLGKTPAETYQILKQTFEEDALDPNEVYNWFKHFIVDRSLIDDDLCSEQLLTRIMPEIITAVQNIVLEVISRPSRTFVSEDFFE